MRIFQYGFLLTVLFMISSCDQQVRVEELIPKDEVAIAQELLSELSRKNYANIERQLDPGVQSPSVRGELERMASLFPAEQPKSVSVVGSKTHTFNGRTTYDLTIEYQYPSIWLVTNVVLQRHDGQVTIIGLNANPMNQSLRELNRFTFEGKGPIHYIVFALSIAVPLFIVYALVLCVKTPIARRKWLWVVFVAVGFVQLSLNWTTGAFGIHPISFLLLGVGIEYTWPYAAVILKVAIPLGAIVFLARRRALIAKSAG